jgi:hypothetical protein
MSENGNKKVGDFITTSSRRDSALEQTSPHTLQELAMHVFTITPWSYTPIRVMTIIIDQASIPRLPQFTAQIGVLREFQIQNFL